MIVVAKFLFEPFSLSCKSTATIYTFQITYIRATGMCANQIGRGRELHLQIEVQTGKRGAVMTVFHKWKFP